MKTNINEELKYIKFLFDYKKGVVISEQSVVTNNTTIDPTKKVDQKNTEIKTKENPGDASTMRNLPIIDEPEDPPTTNQSTQTQTTLGDAEIGVLQTEKKELETKINSIQSTLDVLNRKTESEEKQRIESKILKQIEDLDSYLRSNCGKKMTRLCKEYLKEKNTYNAQMAKLRSLTTTPEKENEKGDPAQKTQTWVGVVSGILGLFTSAITTASMLKRN
jgi:hypothetical protein